MVFSSTGDITRSTNSAGQNATPLRSGILVRRKLLNRAVSAATVALQGAFAVLLPSDSRLRGALLQNVFSLPICPGRLVDAPGIARSERREQGFNQSEEIAGAAPKQLLELNTNLSSDLLVGHRARVSESLTRPQRVESFRGGFEVAHLNQVAAAPRLKNYAMDFEAEPEQEFAFQAR
jgi:hypothetical protein